MRCQSRLYVYNSSASSFHLLHPLVMTNLMQIIFESLFLTIDARREGQEIRSSFHKSELWVRMRMRDYVLLPHRLSTAMNTEFPKSYGCVNIIRFEYIYYFATQAKFAWFREETKSGHFSRRIKLARRSRA